MKFFHLLVLSLLASNFSGRPLGSAELSAVEPITTLSSINPDEEVIPWTDHRLCWDDFLCEPRRGTDAVASTSTSLGIAYQVQHGKLSYNVTCNFSKLKSWGLMRTEYILAHEQGHFDITEVYARKLHEALANYTFNKRSFKKDITDIYNRIVQEKEDCQERYDSESDHSRNRKLQLEWLKHIQTMLEETEEFAAYP